MKAVLENIFWIAIAFVAAIWFFGLLESWHDIGPIDEEEPEDP